MCWKQLCPVVMLFASTLFSAEPLSDFHLTDVNFNSPRSGASVSPRDYVMQVTGYYFGTAT